MSKSRSVTTTAAPTSADALLSTLEIGGGIKIVGTKAVTRPVLRQEDGVPVAVKIISSIMSSEIFERKSHQGEAIMKPADICHVVNLATGEEMTLICNAAFHSALTREYPDDAYVGKYFAFVSQLRPHKEGRRIREYLIKELIVE